MLLENNNLPSHPKNYRWKSLKDNFKTDLLITINHTIYYKIHSDIVKPSLTILFLICPETFITILEYSYKCILEINIKKHQIDFYYLAHVFGFDKIKKQIDREYVIPELKQNNHFEQKILDHYSIPQLLELLKVSQNKNKELMEYIILRIGPDLHKYRRQMPTYLLQYPKPKIKYPFKPKVAYLESSHDLEFDIIIRKYTEQNKEKFANIWIVMNLNKTENLYLLQNKLKTQIWYLGTDQPNIKNIRYLKTKNIIEYLIQLYHRLWVEDELYDQKYKKWLRKI